LEGVLAILRYNQLKIIKNVNKTKGNVIK